MTTDQYERLRAAVQTYDRALRTHGLLGESWVEDNKLDRLWAAVLTAADLDADKHSPRPEETSS